MPRHLLADRLRHMSSQRMGLHGMRQGHVDVEALAVPQDGHLQGAGEVSEVETVLKMEDFTMKHGKYMEVESENQKN